LLFRIYTYQRNRHKSPFRPYLQPQIATYPVISIPPLSHIPRPMSNFPGGSVIFYNLHKKSKNRHKQLLNVGAADRTGPCPGLASILELAPTHKSIKVQDTGSHAAPDWYIMMNNGRIKLNA